MIHHVCPIRQWRCYDCGAAVLRMGVRYFCGKRLSHRLAVRETGCNPDGVSLTKLKKVFRSFGVSVGRIEVKTKAIREALNRERLVVIDDNTTYVDSHVILIVGHTRTRFWLIDPIIGLPTLRSCRNVIRGAESAFTIYRKNTNTRRERNIHE